jgi:hypothetical protein
MDLAVPWLSQGARNTPSKLPLVASTMYTSLSPGLWYP